jgi:hypothetical protein
MNEGTEALKTTLLARDVHVLSKTLLGKAWSAARGFFPSAPEWVVF